MDALPPIDTVQNNRPGKGFCPISRKGDKIMNATDKVDFIMEFILIKKDILHEVEMHDALNTTSCVAKGLDFISHLLSQSTSTLH